MTTESEYQRQIEEKDKRISEIRDLVLDDVPHQYQTRLLEKIDGKKTT